MIPAPTYYRRLYLNGSGPEYRATPDLIRVATRSMLENANGSDPFRLRVRLDNGSSVTVKPRGR